MVSLTSSPTLFNTGKFDGYRLAKLSRITPVNSARPIQSTSLEMNDLRVTLLNLLTLAMVAGILLQLAPLRRFVATASHHPAFWLALVGFCSIPVAPLPVSLAVIAAAIVLPQWARLKTA